MEEMEKRFQRLCSEELTYLRGGVFRIVGNADDIEHPTPEVARMLKLAAE